ncbi:nuclear hormone receptor HR96 [Anopheles maculipalpis]|uniref:nuclear hormone receptor HR96 n=1 Tax=Anopheles maculipalpis TaxID=1496333 RepID=UPI002158F8D6|nr:nuclear hormone receptor HR96 [Anopheles maculipalpis]
MTTASTTTITMANGGTVPDGESLGANSAISKICSVCGDKALGYNFNAVTCESCKAFFRRNALSTKGFTCPFNENCDITVVTRRFCQKCRLEKCFRIGMKKEYIMSEEDKVLKRKKIEQNRAKKRLSNGSGSEAGAATSDREATPGRTNVPTKIKREKSLETFDGGDCWNNSSSSEYGTGEVLIQANGTGSSTTTLTTAGTILEVPSNSSNQSMLSNGTSNDYSRITSPSELSSTPSSSAYNNPHSSLSSDAELLSSAVASLQSSSNGTKPQDMSQTQTNGRTGVGDDRLPPVTIDSSAEDIVNRIVNYPTRASQTIASLMKSPKDAVFIMSKIINSQCDALKLISHFITAPGDALQIISKIMNSPLDALTVFAQFMSSPTDALQLIGKIVSSPADVLQFMQQLMNQPEDALQVMNKFMSSPAEALQMINKMMNHSDIVKTIKEAADTSQKDEDEQQQQQQHHHQQEQQPSLLSAMQQPIAEHQIHQTDLPLASSCIDSVASDQHQMIRSIMQEATIVTDPVGTISAAASPSSTSNYETPYTSMLDPLLSSTTTSLVHSHNYSHSHHQLQMSTGIQPASPSCSSDIADVVFAASSTFGHDPPIIVPPSDDLGIFQDIEAKPVMPHTLESVLMQAIKLEYEGYNSSPIGTSSSQQSTTHHSTVGSNSIELNDAERAKLNELIVANKALYAPVDDDLASLISDDCRIKSNQTQQDPQLLKVINLTAIAIRRLIKMSKKISAFKNMCQEDQLALLKGGCTEMMILRSAMQYDCDRATWKIPHSQEEMSNIRADVLKLAKGNVYQEHERFIRTFEKKWRSDENIILIMCAITLFSPDRPKTIHSDVIKLEQNSYYYLLRRYLESIYPGCEARSVFLKLMQKISELHFLNDEIISVYLNVNPSEVEPLLREIFDLKVH